MASTDWVKTTTRWDEKHLSLEIWCVLYKRLYGRFTQKDDISVPTSYDYHHKFSQQWLLFGPVMCVKIIFLPITACMGHISGIWQKRTVVFYSHRDRHCQCQVSTEPHKHVWLDIYMTQLCILPSGCKIYKSFNTIFTTSLWTMPYLPWVNMVGLWIAIIG